MPRPSSGQVLYQVNDRRQRCGIDLAQTEQAVPLIDGSELERQGDRRHRQPIRRVWIHPQRARESGCGHTPREGHDEYRRQRGREGVVLNHDEATSRVLGILQAEADRYCDALRARGFGRHVPKWDFRVYVDPAFHDHAIQTLEGFSAAYLAVKSTSKSGHATIFVNLGALHDDEDPMELMRDRIFRSFGAALGPGLAFVTRPSEWRAALAKSAAERAERERTVDPWETDPVPLKLGNLMRLRALYPQDYLSGDAAEKFADREVSERPNARHDHTSSGMHRNAPDKERT